MAVLSKYWNSKYTSYITMTTLTISRLKSISRLVNVLPAKLVVGCREARFHTQEKSVRLRAQLSVTSSPDTLRNGCRQQRVVHDTNPVALESSTASSTS
jgi:hypothetical protein